MSFIDPNIMEDTEISSWFLLFSVSCYEFEIVVKNAQILSKKKYYKNSKKTFIFRFSYLIGNGMDVMPF